MFRACLASRGCPPIVGPCLRQPTTSCRLCCGCAEGWHASRCGWRSKAWRREWTCQSLSPELDLRSSTTTSSRRPWALSAGYASLCVAATVWHCQAVSKSTSSSSSSIAPMPGVEQAGHGFVSTAWCPALVLCPSELHRSVLSLSTQQWQFMGCEPPCVGSWRLVKALPSLAGLAQPHGAQ